MYFKKENTFLKKVENNLCGHLRVHYRFYKVHHEDPVSVHYYFTILVQTFRESAEFDSSTENLPAFGA